MYHMQVCILQPAAIVALPDPFFLICGTVLLHPIGVIEPIKRKIKKEKWLLTTTIIPV